MLRSDLTGCLLCSERRMKPLLPRTESYLVPIQLPVASSLYLPSPSGQLAPSSSSTSFSSSSSQKQSASRGAKRVRIAPKVKTLDSGNILQWCTF